MSLTPLVPVPGQNESGRGIPDGWIRAGHDFQLELVSNVTSSRPSTSIESTSNASGPQYISVNEEILDSLSFKSAETLSRRKTPHGHTVPDDLIVYPGLSNTAKGHAISIPSSWQRRAASTEASTEADMPSLHISLRLSPAASRSPTVIYQSRAGSKFEIHRQTIAATITTLGSNCTLHTHAVIAGGDRLAWFGPFKFLSLPEELQSMVLAFSTSV
ncbi:hypothetical protein FKW77_002644 [Venturia effusa]|uniref:Uncharacterized protein n=1 Tax=Venturia effusa TaxID=50376 RepID=A0A517LL18_9PEZI|nr:hypothetical protein FKW77_002644 [Venturia effusa]